MNFFYQSEKFSAARRTLMLPHPQGEDTSIVHAFDECSYGLNNLDRTTLDDHAREWVRRLEELMDTTGLVDTAGEGPSAVKARKLSVDERYELSLMVDDLADWFDHKTLGVD